MPLEDYDCTNCIHKDTCARAQAGTFCTRFQATPDENDPADNPCFLWARGEDVDGLL